MGYYSEVHIAAEPKAYQRILDALGKHKELRYECGKVGKVGVIVFDWVKWYANDSVIQDVYGEMDFIDIRHDDDPGWGYKIMVLSEDDNHDERFNTRGFARLCGLEIQVRIQDDYASEATLRPVGHSD